MRDITNCKEQLNRFLGSERKKTILIDGFRYLVKFPDPTRDKHRGLSYINNVYSEYIGCHVYKALGIPVQETILASYTQSNGKEKVVCACRDFTNANQELREFDSLMVSNVESEDMISTDIKAIEQTIIKSQNLPKECKEEIIKKFWDMFVVDALICNTDRHNSNWGFLVDVKTGDITFSPIYDCGSSLFPLLSEQEMQSYGKNSVEFKNLIYNTYSCLRCNGKRINYSSFIKSGVNVHCNQAVKRIVPQIEMNKLHNIVDHTEGISAVRSEFYKSVMTAQYENILLSTLEKK